MNETSKFCPGCQLTKPHSDFHTDRSRKDRLTTYCGACGAAKFKAWGKANPRKRWATKAVGHARARARQKGLPFALTQKMLIEMAPDVCPVLGIPLDYEASHGHGVYHNTPTVDQVVVGKGYVSGNFVIVSLHANRIKSDATPDELRRVADFYSALTPPINAP